MNPIVFENEEVLNEYVDCKIAISMMGSDSIFDTLVDKLINLKRTIKYEDLGTLRFAIQNKKTSFYVNL